jgi:hypothetical protein
VKIPWSYDASGWLASCWEPIPRVPVAFTELALAL